MKDETQFQIVRPSRVCINLEPRHYVFLKQLAQLHYRGDLSKTIFYLISKYLRYLYKIKIQHLKKTMTITYQPKTKEYKKYYMIIDPLLWGQLYQLRNYLGYSMSFLLRIIIEWELQESTGTNNILKEKPELTPEEQLPHPTLLVQSYAYGMRGDFIQRSIYMFFSDEYY